MRGDLGHPFAVATRAHAANFATECDEGVLATTLAMHPNHAPFQVAASEVTLHRKLDETRQRYAIRRRPAQRLRATPARRDHAMQRGMLRLAAVGGPCQSSKQCAKGLGCYQDKCTALGGVGEACNKGENLPCAGKTLTCGQDGKCAAPVCK